MKRTVQHVDGMRFLAEEVLRPRRVGALEAAIRIVPDPPHEIKERLLAVAGHATLIKTLARPPQVDIHFTQE